MTRLAPRTFAVTALLALVAAVVAAMLLHGPEPSLDARVQSVSEQLRCPTCISQSVAESDSPMAESMRHTIRLQLAGGADQDQVVEWFRTRYGDSVVLSPRGDGLGVALWLGPVLALAAAVALAALVTVRSRPGRASALGPRRAVAQDRLVRPPVPARHLLGVGLVVVLVGALVPLAVGAAGPGQRASETTPVSGRRADAPPDADAWAALARDMDAQARYDAAVNAWREALDLRPGSAGLRTRLAFDQLRAGRPAAAARSSAPVARRPGEHRALAVLVLGLARRATADPRAEPTLRRFLDLAPEHPAAGEVHRLLGADR